MQFGRGGKVLIGWKSAGGLTMEVEIGKKRMGFGRFGVFGGEEARGLIDLQSSSCSCSWNMIWSIGISPYSPYSYRSQT